MEEECAVESYSGCILILLTNSEETFMLTSQEHDVFEHLCKAEDNLSWCRWRKLATSRFSDRSSPEWRGMSRPGRFGVRISRLPHQDSRRDTNI